MNELRNEEFRNTYIPDKIKQHTSQDITPDNISFIEEGVLNYVFRVEMQSGDIFFKQALEKAKAHDKIGTDLASIPKERILFATHQLMSIRWGAGLRAIYCLN